MGAVPGLTLGMLSKRYSVVLIDRTTRVVRRFTVPLWPLAAVIALLMVLPLLMGLGARWSAYAELEHLRAANASLEMENGSYREATVQLSSQIATLQAVVDDIGGRAMVDPSAARAMERLPAAVRSRAMGGGVPATAAPPGLSGAMGPADAAFGLLSDILSLLETRLDTVRTGVERRQALAAATPSIWPVPGWLSSSYGHRQDPFTGSRSFHPGLDISAEHGEPVLATADGVVSSAGTNGNYGNLVVVDHGYGIQTKYGHLSRFGVAAGQRVTRGDVIGYVGSTGRSTSPHLHYEIWVNGRLTNPMRLLGPK